MCGAEGSPPAAPGKLLLRVRGQGAPPSGAAGEGIGQPRLDLARWRVLGAHMGLHSSMLLSAAQLWKFAAWLSMVLGLVW